MNEASAKILLDQMASKLGEHFEAVQIMVTWQENGQTFGLKRGVGNWYARVAMAQEMVSIDRSCDMASQLSRVISKPEPPDDGDGWKKPD